jgi:hypothetical protein
MIAKQYFKMFFWLFLVALLYLSLSPIPAVTPNIQNSDKVVHAAAYGLLFALAVKAYNARAPLWVLLQLLWPLAYPWNGLSHSLVTAMLSPWIWLPMAQALQ